MTLAERFVLDPQNMRLFQQERAIVEVTDLLEETMKALGITRSQLAKKLGKSKPWVTQLLDGEGNKTIRTVADAFAAIGYEYRSFCEPITSVSNTKRRRIASDAIAALSYGTPTARLGSSPVLGVFRGTATPTVRATA